MYIISLFLSINIFKHFYFYLFLIGQIFFEKQVLYTYILEIEIFEKPGEIEKNFKKPLGLFLGSRFDF